MRRRSSRTPPSHGQDRDGLLERMTGIEPAFSAWEADVLPLNYIRRGAQIIGSSSSDPT